MYVYTHVTTLRKRESEMTWEHELTSRHKFIARYPVIVADSLGVWFNHMVFPDVLLPEGDD
jgi:hypothetical protein